MSFYLELFVGKLWLKIINFIRKDWYLKLSLLRFFKIMVTETNSNIEEMMWISGLQKLLIWKIRLGAQYSGGFSWSGISSLFGVWHFLFCCFLISRILVCSPVSQESVGLPIYHLDAYVYIHKIKTNFSRFFFGNFMKFYEIFWNYWRDIDLT